MQTLVVVLLVSACAIYAAWVLMPSIARRALANGLLKFPLPSRFAARMRKAASSAASGCGCDGCDAAPAKSADKGAPRTITFHPRRPG